MFLLAVGGAIVIDVGPTARGRVPSASATRRRRIMLVGLGLVGGGGLAGEAWCGGVRPQRYAFALVSRAIRDIHVGGAPSDVRCTWTGAFIRRVLAVADDKLAGGGRHVFAGPDESCRPTERRCCWTPAIEDGEGRRPQRGWGTPERSPLSWPNHNRAGGSRPHRTCWRDVRCPFAQSRDRSVRFPSGRLSSRPRMASDKCSGRARGNRRCSREEVLMPTSPRAPCARRV